MTKKIFIFFGLELYLCIVKAEILSHYGRCITPFSGDGYYTQEANCRNSTIFDERITNCKNQTLVCCPRFSNKLPEPPECGNYLSDRIYGGEITKQGEFPWMALIRYTNDIETRFFCGGTLINDRWVLTAAHCVLGPYVPIGFQVNGVRLGEHDTTQESDCITLVNGQEECSEHIDIDLERYVQHPDFLGNQRNLPNDIALLHLRRRILYTSFIRPICLLANDETNFNFENYVMEIAGWGLTENLNLPSEVKRKASLRVWSSFSCKILYRIINETMHMCAGGEEAVNSCKGDSGGPLMNLVRKNNNQYYNAVGVISFGAKNCNAKGMPAVFLRLENYMDWIQKTLDENAYVP